MELTVVSSDARDCCTSSDPFNTAHGQATTEATTGEAAAGQKGARVALL
jgi:hypothetical protein